MGDPSQTLIQQIPIKKFKGAGPRTIERFQKLGINNAQDLLFHLPFRYQNRTQITPIGALREGTDVLVEGCIVVADLVRGRRRSLLCRIEDGTGFVSLRFFYFTTAQKNSLRRGEKIRCFGEVRRGATGYELYHPEYTLIPEGSYAELEQTLTPVYPKTEGVTQKKIRDFISQALIFCKECDGLPNLLPNHQPAKILQNDTYVALHFLHAPPAHIPESEIALLEQKIHPAQRQLAFEELVAHHLSLLYLRKKIQKNTAPAFITKGSLKKLFLNNLGFLPTNAQTKVSHEIATDLSKNKPMLRLIQGDVGSGKTIVAALAALQCIESGYQAALMVPTEILAQQHFKNFVAWFEPLGISVACLTGKQTQKQKRETLEVVKNGGANIIIGTHALFQKDVIFNCLGLSIIDEQHRFGVHQRLSLHKKGIVKGIVPHQLIMTATPIPRTLAMCAYADLDCSVIDELPPGRTPVETIVISNQRRQSIIDRIHSACKEGKQAYWVCTLIEESEALQCQAAEVTAEELSTSLPDISIGLIHGRLSGTKKTDLMTQFQQGQIDLLVATTVIEVGVDVANASLMIIENPERLGLSQLHQLRGRVGRGQEKSFCVLMYQSPLSNQVKQRLSIMRDSSDGFVVAEKDLELRGPGEVLGTRQTGLMQFKIADYERDQTMLPDARNCAEIILSLHPDNILPLTERWLGANQQYGQV